MFIKLLLINHGCPLVDQSDLVTRLWNIASLLLDWATIVTRELFYT